MSEVKTQPYEFFLTEFIINKAGEEEEKLVGPFRAIPLAGRRSRAIIPVILEQVLEIANTPTGQELQSLLFSPVQEETLQYLFSHGTPQQRVNVIQKIVEVAAPLLAFMEERGLTALSTVTPETLDTAGKPEEIVIASIGLIVHHLTRIATGSNYEGVKLAVGKSLNETQETSKEVVETSED